MDEQNKQPGICKGWVIMTIIFISLWTLAIFLILQDPKNEEMRWASMTAFIGGSGAFGRALIENFIPYFQNYINIHKNVLAVSSWIYVCCTLLNILFLPYAFLRFSFTYIIKENKIKNFLKYFFVLPPVFALINTINNGELLPRPKYNYIIINLYAIPYILIGFFIIAKRMIEQKTPNERKRYSIVLLFASPVLFQMFSVYLSRLMGYIENFRFNMFFFVIMLPFFVYFLISSGVLDVRLKLEKIQRDYSLKIMSSGTMILNHALKNNVLIISTCLHSLKSDYEKSNKKAPEEIEVIEETSQNMLEIINRIKEKTEDFKLVMKNNNLKEILHGIIFLVNNEISNYNKVNISLDCDEDIFIYCDDIHTKEVVYNIIKNAVESIENNEKGKIEINVFKDKKTITVSISDNGKGISKSEINYIYKPFYTTKKLKSNLGLGLTYCAHVMQKHGGNIFIKSKEDIGTTVFLTFPIRRRWHDKGNCC